MQGAGWVKCWVEVQVRGDFLLGKMQVQGDFLLGKMQVQGEFFIGKPYLTRSNKN